ncbi:unnamed protein product [Vitrella brassicaformis CCMP3155]|uniref:Uncharacterized protein n=1 Tax=Vitrella brassicaformis (strain CCMP3155) TaxID=1169540 RepID=A0A0G4EIL8_VITBC|nr:unnamed protein product [Vitrella brassicaformis CCMP3155]|mmetsp:Transcript_17433/g.41891  ORF Transcript_17433/g.41891 Transcript_17433/m.41891 type:complete len:86 (-) Transcript_17433:321-578(-)|eukprot:CEL95850.1 unnamed protein product [Vitrella brassicaformis CCMP3155]
MADLMTRVSEGSVRIVVNQNVLVTIQNLMPEGMREEYIALPALQNTSTESPGSSTSTATALTKKALVASLVLSLYALYMAVLYGS